MHTVKNATFFHFSTSTNYQKGKSYSFGDKLNNFYRFYENYKPAITADENGKNVILSEYTKYIRECIFEEVRQKEFPDYPSRTKCIWLVPPSLESLKFWHAQLPESRSLVKFTCSGLVHEGDERFLTTMYFNFPLQRKLAELYWSGENVLEDVNSREVLFYGAATAVEIYELQPRNLKIPDAATLGIPERM